MRRLPLGHFLRKCTSGDCPISPCATKLSRSGALNRRYNTRVCRQISSFRRKPESRNPSHLEIPFILSIHAKKPPETERYPASHIAAERQEPCQGALPETEPEAGTDDSEPVHPPADSHLTAAADGTGVSPKMAQKVSVLPVADFQWWIHYIVGEVGEDLIGDPDEGLEFTEEFLAGLEQSAAEAAAGNTIPAEEVFRRLGLD